MAKALKYPEAYTPADATRRGIKLCCQWLDYCLVMGWKKSDLDFLQAIWWDHRDKDGIIVGERRGIVTEDRDEH